MNHDCVVVKLVTGEQFIAGYIDCTRDYLIVKNPIVVRVVQAMTEEGLVEKTVTSSFCAMTEETEYSFNMNHVVYHKPLHSQMVPYYNKLLDAIEKDDQEEEIDQDNLLVFELDETKIH